MSDNWIALIPEDPNFVPEASLQHAARDRFAAIAPNADEIEIRITDKAQFFDCGANFERIVCPSCGAEISRDWWNDRMDEDYCDDGFRLHAYETPCCGTKSSLADLIYEWPQGFARFGIDVMNPNIGRLTSEQKDEFERILKTPLRVVYQHI